MRGIARKVANAVVVSKIVMKKKGKFVKVHEEKKRGHLFSPNKVLEKSPDQVLTRMSIKNAQSISEHCITY